MRLNNEEETSSNCFSLFQFLLFLFLKEKKSFAVSWHSTWFVSYLALFTCPLQNSLLNSSLTDETVNSHLFGLAQTMGSIHGLLIHSGIPIGIIENNLER